MGGVGEKEKGLVALSHRSNTGETEAGGSTRVLRLSWATYIETKGLSGFLGVASSHRFLGMFLFFYEKAREDRER